MFGFVLAPNPYTNWLLLLFYSASFGEGSGVKFDSEAIATPPAADAKVKISCIFYPISVLCDAIVVFLVFTI